MEQIGVLANAFALLWERHARWQGETEPAWTITQIDAWGDPPDDPIPAADIPPNATGESLANEATDGETGWQLAWRIMATLARFHPDRAPLSGWEDGFDPLTSFGPQRDGILGVGRLGFVVYNRSRWAEAGANEWSRQGASDELWRRFPHLRWVSNEIRSSVTLRPASLDLSTRSHELLVSAASVLHDVEEINFVTTPAGPRSRRYRLELDEGSPPLAWFQAVQEGRHSETDLLVMPEAAQPDGLGTLGENPRRLRWFVPGSRYEQRSNEASLFALQPGATRFETDDQLVTQTKRFRFNLSKTDVEALGLAAMKRGPDGQSIATLGASDQPDLYEEDLELVGERIQVLESKAGRIAIVICEDFDRFQQTIAPLAQIGPTLIVVLVFDTELGVFRWQGNPSEILAKEDASTIVVNSTALARNPQRSESRGIRREADDLVGASLFVNRSRPARRLVTRSWGKSGQQLMIPQFAPFGTPLAHRNLKPGDVLIVPRPARLQPDADARLHELTAALDGTHATHACVVVAAGDDSAEVVTLDYVPPPGTRRRCALSELANKRSAGDRVPLMVLRHVSPDAAAKAAIEADRLCQPSAQPEYPLSDLLRAAVYLRAKRAMASRVATDPGAVALVNGFAWWLDSGQEGLMCAATVADLFSRVEAPLLSGTEDRLLGLEQTYGLRSLADLPTGPTGSDFISSESMTEIAQLLELLPAGDLAFCEEVLRSVLQDELPDSEELNRRFGDTNVSETNLTLVMTLGRNLDPVEARSWQDYLSENVMPASKVPWRFWTVSDLLASPTLEPVGHISDWGKVNSPTLTG